MKYESCSKDKIRFEIESWYENLRNNEELIIFINKCPILKGTFDLSIIKRIATKK